MQKFNVLDIQGRKVISLTPEGKPRAAAIVDLESLKRLIRLLPTPDLYTQKFHLVDKINQANTLTEVLDIIEDESAFQETVRNILILNVEDAKEYLTVEQMLNEPA